MHIEEIISRIEPVGNAAAARAQERFDNLIKPIGSLGQLESIAGRYAAILRTASKEAIGYPRRALLVWSDLAHGGEVAQILRGEWPANILAAQTGAATAALTVVAVDLAAALSEGADLVQEYVQKQQLGLLGFGCLEDATENNIVMDMAGGILQAAALRIPVILDGLAACLAAREAAQLAAPVLGYCFAGQVTAEAGMEELLAELGLAAPLRLNIAAGDGSGAAVAFSLFDAAIKSYKEMETFAEAGVHVEVKEFSHAEQLKGEQEQQHG